MVDGFETAVGTRHRHQVDPLQLPSIKYGFELRPQKKPPVLGAAMTLLLCSLTDLFLAAGDYGDGPPCRINPLVAYA